MRILVGFLLGLVLAGGIFYAAEKVAPGTLAIVGIDNATPSVPGATMITLTVTERQAVKQDVMTASLRFEQRGTDAQTLQSNINTAIAKALEVIKAEPSVKVSTEAYSVYMNRNVQPVVDADTGKTTMQTTEEWMGAQTIVIEGREAAKVEALAGQLQQMGFAANNIGYSLSPEQGEKVRETLMQGAVAKLQAQADQAARLLGKKGYEIREVSIDGGLPPVMPMYKAMRMEAMASDAAGAAPNAEPGESDVSMTLSARVELKD